ncbi:MAG: hypothetical protein U0176_20550 [Bacteroidia bacterium]
MATPNPSYNNGSMNNNTVRPSTQPSYNGGNTQPSYNNGSMNNNTVRPRPLRFAGSMNNNTVRPSTQPSYNGASSATPRSTMSPSSGRPDAVSRPSQPHMSNQGAASTRRF